jgi:drug/metabolite transporter (DMT)-like permease
MSPFVITIVITSTFMHAGWNLIARYERSESQVYKKMLIFIGLVGFVPAVISEWLTRSMTPLAWVCVTGAGICAGFYLFFLAKAFESSDFTIVYPVARSLPVILIAVIDTLRGRYLTAYGWMGILLVAAGCALVPLTSFRDVSLGRYINRTSLWMLLTALGTVGYTFLDKVAAEVVQSGPATAARYGYFYFLISFFPYVLLLHFFGSAQSRNNSASWKISIPVAILGFSAYWLILWAYQLSPYAGYIYAFRQFSIVIGAVLAFIIYKEKGVAVRMTGALLITGGLVLIGLLGG